MIFWRYDDLQSSQYTIDELQSSQHTIDDLQSSQHNIDDLQSSQSSNPQLLPSEIIIFYLYITKTSNMCILIKIYLLILIVWFIVSLLWQHL